MLLGYGQKCSLPIRLQYFYKNEISRTNQSNSLIFCILIPIQKNQILIDVLGGNGQSGYETLKFSITQEWALEINWFLHDATNSGKLKVSSMIFG